MEETILVGDDLMMGPPSPVVPPEIASHVLRGVDLCDGILKNLFCDKEIRNRLQESERKLGSSMPFDEAKERVTQLEKEVTSLDRKTCLKQDSVMDLQDILRRFSFDNICKFSFGVDPGCLQPSLPVSPFAAAFDTASKLSAERAMTSSPITWKIKRLLNIGSEKKLKQAIKITNNLAEELINKRRKIGFSTRKDLLSRFMSSVENDNKYLRDIIVSFLLAGRDTVAAALTGFFFLLSKNPSVEVLIREELDRILDNPVQECASFEQLQRMHYLTAAIYESMRLFPPVQFDSKFAQEDDVLPDGTFVPMGTRVTYHPYAMGRMERVWGSDCLKFKPERWLHDGVFVPEDPFKYPVFRLGLGFVWEKSWQL
ncbi:Cytochrome P450 [Arachis hypogaea]|nr:Cytochrome P450 [Arachis hypogaea]